MSQLKANLAEAGYSAKVLYLNLLYAERIGWWIYEWISNINYDELLGEFIFSSALYQRSEEEVQSYVEDVLGSPPPDVFLPRFMEGRSLTEKLMYLIREASEFCQSQAPEEVLAHDPWLVGLTSSFHQNCASMSLIREVKQRRPEVLAAMGGANCEAEMGEELLEQFPEVDFIGQGECDHSFVELVRSLREGGDGSGVPGFLVQGNGQPPCAAPLLSGKDLDKLPHPDFDDYFAHVRSSTAVDQILPALTMEASRGCWWGAKKHCTFCGLNGMGMEFRNKSASRTHEEMTALVEKYDTHYIAMVDNILDMKYFKTLLPKLADDPVAELFYETKANLKKEQVELLRDAEIKWIQPGIESLSDSALQLMRKGTTKLQNVQLLKWCAEYRLDVDWIHLFGFPGESEEELGQVADEAPLLYHLHPPMGAGPLRLDRFSPYGRDPGEFGLEPLSPAEAYRRVYPFSNEALERLAYFFETDEPVSRSAASGAIERLKGAVHDWQAGFARSYLVSFPGKNRLNIIDTRKCSRRYWHRLEGAKREVYESCDQIRSRGQLREAFESIPEHELDAILASLVSDKLLMLSGDRYLGLAVDARKGFTKFPERRPGGHARPPQTSQRLSRDLALMFSFRASPARILRAVSFRAGMLSRRLMSNAMERTVNALIRRSTGRIHTTQAPGGIGAVQQGGGS